MPKAAIIFLARCTQIDSFQARLLRKSFLPFAGISMLVKRRFFTLTVRTEDKVRSRTEMSPLSRAKRLVNELVADLHLDLSGMVVLTEAASGNYVFTPLIAAVANAKKVIAVTRDSGYGKAKDVTENTLCLAKYFDIEKKRIKIASNLTPEIIGEADIVTNLGFLRPLDKQFISSLKKTAAISLMYETWEFREEDLDLRECWRRGIPVLGTNEEHSALRIFDYIGHLCLKVLFEAEIEVFRSKILLIGDNRFSRNMVKTLTAVGAAVYWMASARTEEVKQLGGTKISSDLEEPETQNSIRDCDAVIVNTYPNPNAAIGERGMISTTRLKELTPGTTIIQFNGYVERESLKKWAFAYLPKEEPRIGHMGWTLAHLGPKPVIALNGGGLKVGEVLARARLKGLDRVEAEREALKNSICQNFSPDQRREHEVYS